MFGGFPFGGAPFGGVMGVGDVVVPPAVGWTTGYAIGGPRSEGRVLVAVASAGYAVGGPRVEGHAVPAVASSGGAVPAAATTGDEERF